MFVSAVACVCVHYSGVLHVCMYTMLDSTTRRFSLFSNNTRYSLLKNLISYSDFLDIKLTVWYNTLDMQNVVRHYVCETVIATSSKLDIGRM